ncbi:hypothetical protein Pcinc_022988 [Petrolisthes cinctipes]|uniref:G-protein coupled receptors family 1 profile domain-containing protein n=1 Tax=Petrolisthes cinctipes TaxID=88211 RepID=A0AAE1FE15_PETCI|nr:hypothetical protein Pcinc_022988 [Petrolisthes cinctipes]
MLCPIKDSEVKREREDEARRAPENIEGDSSYDIFCQMASLAEEVIIIIHVLTLCCCIGVCVVCDEAVGDGFLPTTMPATEAAGKPFPSGADNLTTNMNSSGSLEVSFSTDEGGEEEEKKGGKGKAMGPIPNNVAESSCFSSLPRRIKEDMMHSPAHKDYTSVTINKFWPTCLYNMMMFITGVNGTFVTDWWYLGPSCKRQEILLLVSSISVTVLTLAGNIFVLTVIVTSGLLQDTTFMIRASLAFADLLMGLIPASLAVYDQFGLMNGRLTLRNLNEDILLTNIPYIIDSQSPGFQQLRFQRKGFLPILACFSFNVSTMVSLLTLAILSLERLCVMRGRPLSRAFMLRSIILSWVAGILLSFLVNWRKEGIDFTGYFDPITKLTLNIGANAYSVSRWVFYLEICVMGLAGTTVIVCGTATLILYILHHRLTKAVLTIHSCNRDVELRRTTIIFALMVGIFTMTVGLVIIDVFADLAVTKPLAHWLIWWVFVAASSWNWALYTLSGGRFRVQIRSLLSCGRIRRSQPHCSPQHISFGSSMFHGMFRKKKALLQVELTSISNTHKDINK